MLAIYILFTLLFFIVFSVSFYFFVHFKIYDSIAASIGFCIFIFGFAISITDMVHSYYYDNRMTRDIHQGDVFSLPILSSEKRKEISYNHSSTLHFSVGQLTDSLECHQRWSIGQSLQYVFDGSSFSMTVLGRATEPDYR